MLDFLSQKFSDILGRLKNKTSFKENSIKESLDQVHDAMLEADVPLDVITAFLDSIKQEVLGKKILSCLNPSEKLIHIIYEKLCSFLSGGVYASPGVTLPGRILVMGLQGSGKTTSIAKLAYYLKQQASKKGKKRKILFASVDFYRPAALDQLKVLANQIQVDFFKASSLNHVYATQEINDYAVSNKYDLVFLDTAGRLHIDQILMQELRQIYACFKPTKKILVLDAMTGQESLSVAQAFNDVIGFDGSILTKMDSQTRGGAAFAFSYSIKKPIEFLGIGEKMDDLEIFVPKRIASRILGMGDLQSLAERADQHVNPDSQASMVKRMMSGRFTLQDFADQMAMLNKLGPLQKIMRYMPGSYNVSSEKLEQGQQQLKEFKAVISSMTPKERFLPKILNASRRNRIAHGSGTTIQTVNNLVLKFEESRQLVKIFSKSNKFNKF